MARLQCPSRTAPEPPEPDLYVEVCVDWFARRTEPWVGPPLVEPSTLPLFKGESTGPAPARSRAGCPWEHERQAASSGERGQAGEGS